MNKKIKLIFLRGVRNVNFIQFTALEILFTNKITLNFLCLSFLGKAGKADGKSANCCRFTSKTEVKHK